MSHLSRIKTCINNIEILEKTLKDLKFKYEYRVNSTQRNINPDILVKENQLTIFELSWNGQEYSLLADLQLWNLNISFERLLDKITQSYSYNSIILEGTKHGFTNVKQEILQDGSIKLMIQRWN